MFVRQIQLKQVIRPFFFLSPHCSGAPQGLEPVLFTSIFLGFGVEQTYGWLGVEGQLVVVDTQQTAQVEIRLRSLWLRLVLSTQSV